MLAIYFFIALSAAVAGSFWIDWLYKLPTAPLSFPEKIFSRGRFRKILLTIIFFAAIIFCAEMSTLQATRTLTAIFFLSLIIMTDFEQYVIFDKMLFPFAILSLPFIVGLNFSLANHFSAAFFGGGIFFILMIISKNGLGGGDVKLIFVLGLWLGVNGLIFVILSGAILAGISALILLLTKIKNRQDVFAYGPYFCISAIGRLIFDFKFF